MPAVQQRTSSQGGRDQHRTIIPIDCAAHMYQHPPMQLPHVRCICTVTAKQPTACKATALQVAPHANTQAGLLAMPTTRSCELTQPQGCASTVPPHRTLHTSPDAHFMQQQRQSLLTHTGCAAPCTTYPVCSLMQHSHLPEACVA